MSSIRPLVFDDFDHLFDLFMSFPHKAEQQKFQGIDAHLLAEFFVEGQKKGMGHRLPQGGSLQWVSERDGQLTGLAALQNDDWHSKFYPWRFGRIAPFLTHRASPEGRGLLADRMLDLSREAQMKHLMVRVDGSEYGAVSALTARGFYLVDNSVKLGGRLSDLAALAAPSAAQGMQIREYDPADLEAVMEIAATSHPYNHYYNDPWLEKVRSQSLFEGWVKRCCTELKAAVYVVVKRDKPCGFVIYLKPTATNAALRTHLVILDFVCLAQGARGGGVGRWLMSQTLRRLAADFSQVELRTSQNNYPALASYQALGMRVISTDFVLHRHEG